MVVCTGWGRDKHPCPGMTESWQTDLVETHKRTPLELFNLPQHFIVPLFQRPYVWREEEQWEPLWKDVRRVAELRISEPHVRAQHFLGAVVLQSYPTASQQLTAWRSSPG